MNCRRCHSLRLLQLDKKLPADNDVFRCQDCGFLFSPPTSPQEFPQGPPDTGASRATAIRSGYRAGA